MPKIFEEYIIQRYIKDFIFYPPLMFFSVLASRLPIDLGVILGLGINYLLLFCSFLYNDIEDAEDDAKSVSKRFKNPFGYKVWSYKFGYYLLFSIALISFLASYYIGGEVVLFLAVSNFIVGLLYSNKMLRLKAWPIIDLSSHAYLLAAVQVLFFMYLPNGTRDIWSWLIVFGIFLFSAGGDLLNEYRDYEDDREAGLLNTASFLGKGITKLISRSMFVLGSFLLAYAAMNIIL